MYDYIQTHTHTYIHMPMCTNINSTGDDVCSKHPFCSC